VDQGFSRQELLGSGVAYELQDAQGQTLAWLQSMGDNFPFQDFGLEGIPQSVTFSNAQLRSDADLTAELQQSQADAALIALILTLKNELVAEAAQGATTLLSPLPPQFPGDTAAHGVAVDQVEVTAANVNGSVLPKSAGGVQVTVTAGAVFTLTGIVSESGDSLVGDASVEGSTDTGPEGTARGIHIGTIHAVVPVKG
jgi:hypothetical protein